MRRGPRSLARHWARMRCAALVGAKAGRIGMPRNEEVLPVTMMAPSPRAIIAGASFCARKNKDVVFTRKFRSRSATLRLEDRGEGRRDGVVDEHMGRPELGVDALDDRAEPVEVGDVARIGAGAGDPGLEPG